MKKNLLLLRARSPQAFAGALYMAASSIMTTAIRLVPVDTGWLRASRYVSKPRVQGGKFNFTMGFAASYAIFVHEIWKKYIVGEWKFLSKAVDFHRPTFLTEVARMTAGLFAAGRGIDDVPEVHPTAPPLTEPDRAALEGLATRYRRKKSKRTKKRREKARTENAARVQRESAAGLAAQRDGRRPPRPGRG